MVCKKVIPTVSFNTWNFIFTVQYVKNAVFPKHFFSSTGNVVIQSINDIYAFAFKYNEVVESGAFGIPVRPEQYLKAGQLNAMGLIDEIFHNIRWNTSSTDRLGLSTLICRFISVCKLLRLIVVIPHCTNNAWSRLSSCVRSLFNVLYSLMSLRR